MLNRVNLCIRVFVALLVLINIHFSTVGQIVKQWKDTTRAGYKYRFVPGDPMQVRFYTLPNGLTVILSVEKKTPRVQTLIAVRSGSNNDPNTHTGLAHYLEHLLFKGTTKFGTADWTKEKPLIEEITKLYDRYNVSIRQAPYLTGLRGLLYLHSHQ